MLPLLLRGGGALLLGKRPNPNGARQGGLLRLPGKVLSGNFAFNVGQWDAFFSRWMPNVTRTVNVKVIGAKGTSLSGVVQFAMSTAMSVLRQTKKVTPINYGLGLKVDHVNNMVNVVITTQSLALYEGIVALNKLIEKSDEAGFWNVGEVDVDALAAKIGAKLGGNAPAWLAVLGIDIGDLGKFSGRVAVIAQKLAELLSTSVGGQGFWDIGINKEYRGGDVFPGLSPPDLNRQREFNALVDTVLFTRNPAPNHQPPSYAGGDMRTLLAQVLHDPGLVPPRPTTDQGKPTVNR